MPGDTDLNRLLTAMQPSLSAECFTFCTVATRDFSRLPATTLSACIGLFREAEGTTLLLPIAQAEAQGLIGEGMWACITLSIHSDLQAVGFLAAITAQLAQCGISVNAISAFYHDHLFVPWEQRKPALRALETFTEPPA